MENHFVLCGWNQIAKIAFKELIASGHRVSVINNDPNETPEIEAMGGDAEVSIVLGDPSTQEALIKANIVKSVAALVCMDEDTKTLITTLHIRANNPTAKIIASIRRKELKKTLKVAGVTFVASPYEMTGRLVASASFEPDVGVFLEDVSTSTSGYDIQQYTIGQQSPIAAVNVKQARELIKQNSGAMLIAIAKLAENDWKLLPNPKNDVIINQNDIVLILGNEEETENLAGYLKAEQGR